MFFFSEVLSHDNTIHFGGTEMVPKFGSQYRSGAHSQWIDLDGGWVSACVTLQP